VFIRSTALLHDVVSEKSGLLRGMNIALYNKYVLILLLLQLHGVVKVNEVGNSNPDFQVGTICL
jgi:hypothetical protein